MSSTSDNSKSTPRGERSSLAPDLERLGERWTQELGGLDVTTFVIAASVQRLAQHFEREFVALARREGLGPGDLRILLALRRAGEPYELRPVELFRQLLITSGAVSKQVDRLAERGLVRRTVHPDDTRIQLVRLKGSGREIAEHLMEQMSAEFCGLETLSDKEARAARRMLSTLLVAVERSAAGD